ncbi:hypothetical protein AAHB55_25965 [Bacillus cereus]
MIEIMMENGRRKMYLAKQKLHGHLVVQIKRITIINNIQKQEKFKNFSCF